MAKLNIKPGDRLTLTIRLDGRAEEDRAGRWKRP